MAEDPGPIVAIGSDTDFVYRLMTEAYGLVSHDQNRSGTTAESEPLISYYVIGVNTTVQPREPALPTSRRKANMSEISTRSAESDDNQIPGFIFFQLGALEYARHNQDGGWSPALGEMLATRVQEGETGFHLVARAGQFGGINGVYAIYSMFPDDESTGTYQQATHPFWSIPPRPSTGASPHEQFSVARVGDNLGRMGYNKLLVGLIKLSTPSSWFG
ncbi:hypothetical protein B0T25DRAFT_613093 [Lasiosphaeria hispida]|uniref:Uncharacterized protein n=1 Tax=Lasiosphaeria hispida TaxID=260671 RepID=A0AAJ0HBH5_9PEZI|nr:hypothetical protein B0T25DRAFT_613093 [Lasiosphaeria hispida]